MLQEDTFDEAALRTERDRYRNALMWALDYFGANNLSTKERAHGVREIGKVLTGRPSRAADYKPSEWDDSAALAAEERQP